MWFARIVYGKGKTLTVIYFYCGLLVEGVAIYPRVARLRHDVLAWVCQQCLQTLHGLVAMSSIAIFAAMHPSHLSVDMFIFPMLSSACSLPLAIPFSWSLKMSITATPLATHQSLNRSQEVQRSWAGFCFYLIFGAVSSD